MLRIAAIIVGSESGLREPDPTTKPF